MVDKAILQEHGNIQAQISSKIDKAIDDSIPSQVDASVRSYMSRHILHVHPDQSQTVSVPEQQYQLYLAMKADPQMQQQDIAIWLALQIKFKRTQVPQTACRPSAVHPRDQEDPYDDAYPERENSAKRQKTSEYEAYVSGESSSGQVNEEEPGLSTSGNQEHDDDFDFWTDSYASDDDEIPTKQVSQDIMEEISLTIDKAKLKKMADEMLRQRCTSGDEHQKATPLVLSCQRNLDAPALSLINQDLLYLKKGNSGPEKIVLSLHKFHAVIFNDDDIEEQTSRWVNKCVKKFNPYARYGVEHWKNPHAKIFYIRKQKEPGRQKEEIYSNSKIVQVIKTYWELVFIRSSVIWERVHDFQLGIKSYQQKVNLTAPTMNFLGIEEYEVFSIVYEPVHGIIYKNSKKEKRVMRHFEIHKFCDATLMRVLEGLKSYNNDVKYGYVQKEFTSDEVKYLKLFEEEIKGLFEGLKAYQIEDAYKAVKATVLANERRIPPHGKGSLYIRSLLMGSGSVLYLEPAPDKGGIITVAVGGHTHLGGEDFDMDPAPDPLSQSRQGQRGPQRTSSTGVSSDIKKASSIANIVDDLSSIFTR
ncbi:retrovirus-related pol polyprotein from transposon TNT 1-94 [Tanacetum coccineum]